MSKKQLLSKKQIQYLEAVVYILAIIVAIFANIYGSIYIKMIPLLIILGIIGKLMFKRSVTTTIFGMVVAMCIIHIKMHVSIIENLMLSGIIALDIAMGELFGEYIKRSYKGYKKSKENHFKITDKLFTTYIYTIIIGVLALSINTYINGNVVNLETCKHTLEKYLKDNYQTVERFDVLDIKYTFGLNRKYTFYVQDNSNRELNKYVIYLKNKDVVVDEYKSELLEENNNRINSDLKQYITDIDKEERYSNFDISAEYTDETNIKINIKKKVNNITDLEKEEFAKQIASFLEDIENFKEYDNLEELVISIDNINDNNDIISANIYVKGYKNNIKNSEEEPCNYILKSLMIEYISY